jgi:serine/threonine protein kinase
MSRFGLTRLLKRSVDGGFEYFAAKFYNSGDNREGLQTFLSRINPIAALSHPHVMPIVGLIEPTRTQGPVVITRYSECGSLLDVLDRVRNNDPPPFWSSEAKLSMILGLLSGFRYLHSHGIVHRELKPSDLIVEFDGSIRICGYLTSIFEEYHYTRASQVSAPSYMAPEVYEEHYIGERMRNPKSDVFSFALILYELLFGPRVFPQSMSAAVIMRKAMSARPRDRPALPAGVHPVLREIIQRGWGSAAEKRVDFESMWKCLRDVGFKIFSDVEVDWIPLLGD